jgi:hypothetical protein
MGKTDKSESPFKTTYGKLTRREVIQLLRTPKRRPLWELCLLVAGFNPNNKTYSAKWANVDGGAAVRFFTMAVTKAGREVLGLTGDKPTQLVGRAEFMEWLKIQVGEASEEEQLKTDIVARTVADYRVYQATPMGSAARDNYIANLPGPNLEMKGLERRQQIRARIDALIKEQKPSGNKKDQVLAMAEWMIKNKDPLAKNNNGGFLKPKSLLDYYQNQEPKGGSVDSKKSFL